jgi:hypothetical protein
VSRPSPGTRQFSTHRQLLARTSSRRGRAGLDAIIVPASRPAANLDHAVTLARALNCQLVVLCSRQTGSAAVNDLLAARNFAHAIVVDVPPGYCLPDVEFATSKLLELDYLPRSPNGDLSAKRNIGVLLARKLGWQRIFFLDDDIRDLNASDIDDAASMLGPLDAVGMRSIDYPDNSVVCHGHRETGAYQDVFIGGSALAVNVAGRVPFFPDIYNEDWFHFYHAAATQKLGWSGRDVTQLCYDPFADPRRAAVQEFGDIMAEGLFGLLHFRLGAERATGDYWQAFLAARMRFLAGVRDRADTVEQYLRQRIVTSVDAAQDCAKRIESRLCEQYVSLWLEDLARWDQHLTDVRQRSSVRMALDDLGLTLAERNPYVLAGIVTARNVVAAGRPGMPTLAMPALAAAAAQAISAVAGLAELALPAAYDLRAPAPDQDGLVRRAVGRARSAVRHLVLADERRALIPPPEDSGNPRTGRHRRVPEPPAAEPPASKPPASEPPADGRGVVPPASEPAVSEPPAAPQLTAAASLA